MSLERKHPLRRQRRRMVALRWRLLCTMAAMSVLTSALASRSFRASRCAAPAFLAAPPLPAQAHRAHAQSRRGKAGSGGILCWPLMAASNAEGVQKAKQVLESVFGGPDQGGFWVWRKQAEERSGASTRDSRFVDTGDLTYGEFDLDFYHQLVELAEPRQGEVICDLGSGCGRLMLYSALAFGDLAKEYRGIEIMEGLHGAAEEALAKCTEIAQGEEKALLSRVVLKQCDVYEDPSVLDGVDVCFCYSTAWSAFGSQLTQLSYTLGCNMRVGSRIITTDKVLVSDGPWAYDLLHSVEGKNSEVGGSTGYVWRVSKSPKG